MSKTRVVDLLASGESRKGRPGVEEKVLRRLVRAGCDPDALGLIVAHALRHGAGSEAQTRELGEIAEFANSIGPAAARDYFRALRETRAVEPLTDPRVWAFARSVDRHTAEWYFWSVWGTGAVAELTGEPVLASVELFRSLDSPATVEYFLAIRETRAAKELTAERVLAFVREIGSEAALEFFGACWETKEVASLTDPKVLELAQALGAEAAREYFHAIRETRSVSALTRSSVLEFARALGGLPAQEYFRAIRATRSPEQLTDEKLLVFAESIGKGAARQYFRALGSTRAVAALTGDALLNASAVIRSIGSDAALDYFLALASSDEPSPSPGAGGREAGPATAAQVPVLTLLDIPAYDRLQPVGLTAVTAGFWLWAWQFSRGPLGLTGGPWGLLLAGGVWAALAGTAYLLLGAAAQRSTDQFLERRRRLLNEHGIRWHDCLETDRRCERCWSAGAHHDDGRFDYPRFCRCPTC